MSIDSGRRNMAARMLKRTKPVNLVRFTVTGYDNAARTPTGTTVPTPVHARIEKYALQDIGRAGIEAGDLKLTIAAKEAGNPPPSQGDYVEIDTIPHGVEFCDVTMGFREPVLYTVRVRK